MNYISIGNLPVHLFTIPELHDIIRNAIERSQKTVFLHANARSVELANTTDRWFRDFFRRKDTFVMCDGAGIQFAAKLTKQQIPTKIPYNTWIWDLATFLDTNKFSIFLLGGEDAVIKKAVDRLEKFAPGLRIAGYHHGYFDKRPESVENQSVLKLIESAKPDVLLIGFGMPVQEQWIKANYDSIHAKTIFTCGGAFDFISGNKPVAPSFLRAVYLEWLYRAMLEPGRLLKRNVKSNVSLVLVSLKQRFL